jgi:hypothetical protein
MSCRDQHIHLIPYLDIPHHKHKDIIYTKVVCEIQEGKDGKKCTRITVGGNLIVYPGNMGTNTVLLEHFKLMLNSVILCKGAQFLTININNFYLDTPMVHTPNTSSLKLPIFPRISYRNTVCQKRRPQRMDLL